MIPLRLLGPALLALVAGCGHPSTVHDADEYTGCGGDEQLRLLSDGEATAIVDDGRAPQVTEPAAGQSVPFASKIVLKWNQDANNPGMPDGDVPYLDGPGCQGCCPQFTKGSLTTLHLPPLSGSIYDVQFTVDGQVSWRLVTTLQEWTPSDALWAKWKGKAVSLKIWRMMVQTNDPKAGPFVATQPFGFTVGS